MTSLAETFGPTGLLSARLPGFSYREPQQRMAMLVGEAIADGKHAALEAGTGIGKTYAYVVPALLAGQRTIISTGTRTLQDQLFARDLPALGPALGRPVELALLKGRSNYLCWHRLETARLDGRLERRLQDTLIALNSWGKASATGDLTELEDIAEEHSLKGLVSSTVDNCLGSQCEYFDKCFVLKARRKAQSAQVVIVNHHLLLADLALKEAGFGDLLPGADIVIVDEAHLLPDVAQQFFDVTVTSRELELLGRDVLAESRVAGGHSFDETVNTVLRGTADARIDPGRQPGRVAWSSVSQQFVTAISGLQDPLASLADELAQVESVPGLARCRERCLAIAGRLATVVAPDSGDGIRWLESSDRGFGAHWTPLDVGTQLAQRIEDQHGTWVFTSATLAVGNDFNHFLARIGLEDAKTEVLPSPFDYAHNARLHIPDGLPEPRQPEHTTALLAAVWPFVEATAGGVFLLFTSYRALNAAEQWLNRKRMPGPLLVQGRGPRSQLLEEFRAAGNAVLLGTGSFWQGVDVRGPALRMVVIDKLPFAVPSDPLVQARIEAITRTGGDPFKEFQLPQAVLALKQGVGRLIRDFDDQGLIVLGDPRLRTRAYGKLFLASLPPMPQLEDPEEVADYAAALIREPNAKANARAASAV